jgi:hypothetical protein
LLLNSWTVEAIAERCQQHIQKYRHRLDHDLSYCLELFRRAFEEKREEAYTFLYQTYISLIYHWVYQHPYFASLDMPVEYYVADCMGHFFLTMRGNFERFESVPAILRYWQKCVNTVLLNEVRKKRVATVPIENMERYVDEEGMDGRLIQTAIWQRVESLLPENKDRLLAHLVFVQGLKPKQIVEHYSALWSETNEVRVDRQRITRCLVADSVLRQLLRMDKRPD